MDNREMYKSEYNKRAWTVDTLEWDQMDIATFGLIIKNDEWGITISNQSGGLGCTHPIARGIYVPLHVPAIVDKVISDICCYTSGHFDEDELKHYVDLFEEHRNEIFKPIEEFLGYTVQIDMDPVPVESYNNSYDHTPVTQEAWLNVICRKNHDAREGILMHWKHEEFKAVLVYGNSD